MSNRFKNAEKHKRVPPGGGNQVTPPVEEKVEVQAPPMTETQDAPVVGSEFLANLIEPKPEGKSHSFYLSTEASKKLDKLAKQLKCSKSKALDTLIKNVLE